MDWFVTITETFEIFTLYVAAVGDAQVVESGEDSFAGWGAWAVSCEIFGECEGAVFMVGDFPVTHFWGGLGDWRRW